MPATAPEEAIDSSQLLHEVRVCYTLLKKKLLIS